MKTLSFATALALTIGAATASLADVRQIAASAGVGAAEAASMSLSDLAQLKFNAEHGAQERIAIVVAPGVSGASARSQLAAAAGVSAAEAAGMSLTELATLKSNRESRRDDVHPLVAGGATVADAQFAASVGLAPEAAREMSIHEIYLEKIIRQSSDY